MLTLNFGSGPSDSASTFFKMASAYLNLLHDNDFHDNDFHWLLDMLDNDNMMTAKASEVVQTVPTDKKIYQKCSLCVIFSI